MTDMSLFYVLRSCFWKHRRFRAGDVVELPTDLALEVPANFSLMEDGQRPPRPEQDPTEAPAAGPLPKSWDPYKDAPGTKKVGKLDPSSAAQSNSDATSKMRKIEAAQKAAEKIEAKRVAEEAAAATDNKLFEAKSEAARPARKK